MEPLPGQLLQELLPGQLPEPLQEQLQEPLPGQPLPEPLQEQPPGLLPEQAGQCRGAVRTARE